MSGNDFDAKQIEKKVHDLAEAMDRVRNDQVSKSDVVVEMKQAEFARLELLARDLKSVFDQLPDENDQFEFALTGGEPPRLWIDMTSFVRMGRDRRVYEFIKDTRLGRTQLASSNDRERMGKIVTNYVAERVLERERAMEGDWLAMRNYNFNVDGELENEELEPIAQSKNSGWGWSLVAWFAIGLLAGAAAMIAWAWFGTVPTFLK